MKTTYNFAAWADWFRDFQRRQIPIDWNNFERIPKDIHPIVAASVQQFQLGESSEAHHLKASVARFVKNGGDRSYQDAMEWFIFEENRHARLLGRFMGLESMPKAKSLFTDKLFRFARHTVGLRRSILILLSAELVAVPYYTALLKATTSPILTTICNQILLDEATHIRFQAKAIRMMLSKKGSFARRAEFLLARIMLEAALDVVWFNHSALLQLGGYEFAHLRKESLAQLQWAWTMIKSETEDLEPISHALISFPKMKSLTAQNTHHAS